VYATDRGVPLGSSIEALSALPTGAVAIKVGDQYAVGRLTRPEWRPPRWPAYQIYGAVILVLVVIGGIGWILQSLIGRWREAARRYNPIIDGARQFFGRAGLKVERVDRRTLRLKGPIYGESGALATAVLDEFVPVEAIQQLTQRLPSRPPSTSAFAYLLYPRELDPGAAGQLVAERLKNNTIIVPLPVPYMRKLLASSDTAPNVALDELVRRYLPGADLFDFKNAIDEPRFLFGRKSLVDEVVSALKQGEQVALVGLRRIGKTSVLNALEMSLQSFPAIKCDLEGVVGSPDWPERLLVDLIARYDTWGRNRFGDRWKATPVPSAMTEGFDFQRALEERRTLKADLGSSEPLVVMLDELERAFPLLGEATYADQVDRFLRAASALRAVAMGGPGRLISLLVADLRPLANRTNRFPAVEARTNPLYLFFREHTVTALDEPSTKEMLTVIGQTMGLELEAELLDAIWVDSGGFPLVARQLASATARHSDGEVRLTRVHYEAALRWFRDENTNIDAYLRRGIWEYASPAERVVLKRASAEAGVPASDLEAADPKVSEADIRDARRDLLAVSALERVAGSPDRLRARARLFREWLAKNV
jgi:hypothetical protein